MMNRGRSFLPIFIKKINMKIVIFRWIVLGVIIIHFAFIGINQLVSLGYINNSSFLDNNYINLYFEQHWSMFSPNPPKGNQYFVVKYKTEKDTITIDINEKIRKGSLVSIFNINQRILKYQNECYNDILRDIEEKGIHTKEIKSSKSYGLNSILNYSKIVLNKQNYFSKDNNVFVDIYLIDEQLNEPNNKNKYKEKRYIHLENMKIENYDK